MTMDTSGNGTSVQAQFSEDQLAGLAFSNWLIRSRSPGEVCDWLEAEAELRVVGDLRGQLLTVEQRLTDLVIEQKHIDRLLLADYEVSRILVSASSIKQAGPALVQAIAGNLGWDVGLFWLLDSDADVLRCAAIYQATTIDQTTFRTACQASAFPRGTGLPGQVWSHGASISLDDICDDLDFLRSQAALATGLHGWIGFPVSNGTAFLGVMEFLSREMITPTAKTLQMMSSICSHISQFMERRAAEAILHRTEADQQIARHIQENMLPAAMPRLDGFRIYGRCRPADRVGGDCFDFFPLVSQGDEGLGILVADASGHGIGAALLMAETRAYLRALALSCADPSQLLAQTNRLLVKEDSPFVTLFLVRLDPNTCRLTYAGAGHWPGQVLGQNGEVRSLLNSTGPPLALDAQSEFPSSHSLQLEPGDLVFLYTDGLHEAMAPDDTIFGLRNVVEFVQAHRHEAPEDILDGLFETARSFSCGRAQADDMTAVIIKLETSPATG